MTIFGGGFRGAPAFRHRNYRLFFAGQAISLVGTWMQQVAQGWLVLQLTHDPFALGLVAAAQFGPVIVLGLFGGVIADLLPKRQTLIVTQAVSMVLALVLFGLTATGVVEVWHVMVLAALLGVANAVDMPARQAFAVEMVGREDVTNAVGFNAALFNASRIVGPAVAGLLIGAFDISVAFLINGLSYLGAIGAYAWMRDAELRPIEANARPDGVRGVFENLAEGARYVRDTPLVLLSCVVVGLGATFGMNFQVLVPPLADDVLRVGASGFGFLMAASGIGSTVAALTVAFSNRVRARWIAVGAMALGIGGLALAWSPSFPVALLAMLIAGAGGITMAVVANTTIQTNVPDQLRGRVLSVYTTTFAGSVPVGSLLAGYVASRWGVPVAFAGGGLITLVIGVWAWFWVMRIRAAKQLLREAPAFEGPQPQAPTPVAAGRAGEGPIAVARDR
jgi:MFS family permease